MAKDTENDTEDDQEPFENQPSDLDELTHAELRLMYEKASDAVLFAKRIQWLAVGGSVLVFGGFTAFAVLTRLRSSFATLFGITTILLTCGVILVLLMYQFWQFNEISRIVKIEEQFSTLYRKIRDVSSRREGTVQRYTLLFFMCAMVILAAAIALFVLK
tara:strand:+ start:153 stop:632 length:480 start_codon:yes stop_codon:yes gene_type:complete